VLSRLFVVLSDINQEFGRLENGVKELVGVAGEREVRLPQHLAFRLFKHDDGEVWPVHQVTLFIAMALSNL